MYNKPQYTRVSPVNINGKATKRLMVVFKTKGCQYAEKNGPCIHCAFPKQGDRKISDEEIYNQLEYVLSNLNIDEVREIDVLTLGSFYNRNEISEDLRKKMLKRLSTITTLSKISTETRAEYVTLADLVEDKKILGNKIYEVGVGLETVNDFIRNRIIKKGLTRKGFENFILKLKKANIDLLVYILVKPPGLLERESISDAILSARYIFNLSKKYDINTRVAFEPLFVAKDAKLEQIYNVGDYKPLNWWTLIEIIKKTYNLGTIFVGLSDENLSNGRMGYSCDLCENKILSTIEDFNATQDISKINNLDCVCRKDYLSKLNNGKI